MLESNIERLYRARYGDPRDPLAAETKNFNARIAELRAASRRGTATRKVGVVHPQDDVDLADPLFEATARHTERVAVLRGMAAKEVDDRWR
jgi:hypothetical protein